MQLKFCFVKPGDVVAAMTSETPMQKMSPFLIVKAIHESFKENSKAKINTGGLLLSDQNKEVGKMEINKKAHCFCYTAPLAQPQQKLWLCASSMKLLKSTNKEIEESWRGPVCCRNYLKNTGCGDTSSCCTIVHCILGLIFCYFVYSVLYPLLQRPE